MENQQLSLQLDITPKTTLREEGLVMSVDALVEWKNRILTYQQQVRENYQPQQASLLKISPNCDPEKIEPFNLHLQPMSFYRMPDNYGQPALYFVLDTHARLILYI